MRVSPLATKPGFPHLQKIDEEETDEQENRSQITEEGFSVKPEEHHEAHEAVETEISETTGREAENIKAQSIAIDEADTNYK